jgi:hypothetical protein
MTAQPLPALTSGDPSAWDQALYAFLVEKGNRSGLRRTRVSAARVASRVTVERCGEVARAKHRWASRRCSDMSRPRPPEPAMRNRPHGEQRPTCRIVVRS